MELIQTFHTKEVATVFLGRSSEGNEVEFVESTQPPLTFKEKEVVIVSTLVGCPVGCAMCDAGGFYRKKLSADEIFEQIDHVVLNRYGSLSVPAKQFKIQFARMGEPAFNDAVIEVLEKLPNQYKAPGLLPSLSTVAPAGRDEFFEKIIEIKERLYQDRFQFQFSIHSTLDKQKNQIIPIETWTFKQMADYGKRFVKGRDRKVALNFALAKDYIVDPLVLRDFFDPEYFLIKITPVNPTYRSKENNLASAVEPQGLPNHSDLLDKLETLGYRVIVSIGELVENEIGSNCGQYVRRHLFSDNKLPDGYRLVH